MRNVKIFILILSTTISFIQNRLQNEVFSFAFVSKEFAILSSDQLDIVNQKYSKKNGLVQLLNLYDFRFCYDETHYL
jgi:hydroxymethylpyrimidine pyrophosphatase-like HAD family hydrolase